MGTRPLPDKAQRESFRQLIARKRAELLALGFTSKPVVTPKRPSGPHFNQRWHTPLGQAEMDVHMSEKRCAGCGNKVILATGDLIAGLWCGPCNTAQADAMPPAA